MQTINDILSKGDVADGFRSSEKAKELLPDFKQQLHLLQDVDKELDSALVGFLTEAVLGAARYEKRCGDAELKVWLYIFLSSLLVIGIGKLTDAQSAALPAQITAVLTGVLALQKTLSTWYASQQRYAAWYKARSDLKTLYYTLLQTWSGKIVAGDVFLAALRTFTADASKVISDEQLDFFQRLTLPGIDVLDMLTSTRSTVSTFVTGLLPGTAPAPIAAIGKIAVPVTATPDECAHAGCVGASAATGGTR